MYARATTIQGQPAMVDAGIAYVRDRVMPSVLAMDGCVGLSLLVDRTSGRHIVTSAWETEEAMRATLSQTEPMRSEGARIFGGPAMVEAWEIAVLHRDHRSAQGAGVRASWFQSDPANLDRAIDSFKLASLPRIEELDGFCSASLLVQRDTGLCCVSTTYDSAQAMERNRDAATSVRKEGMQSAATQLLEVCEFELALAHLHVPELV